MVKQKIPEGQVKNIPVEVRVKKTEPSFRPTDWLMTVAKYLNSTQLEKLLHLMGIPEISSVKYGYERKISFQYPL
jgi:hypothetical protein